jgi:hypothetical protein
MNAECADKKQSKEMFAGVIGVYRRPFITLRAHGVAKQAAIAAGATGAGGALPAP